MTDTHKVSTHSAMINPVHALVYLRNGEKNSRKQPICMQCFRQIHSIYLTKMCFNKFGIKSHLTCVLTYGKRAADEPIVLKSHFILKYTRSVVFDRLRIKQSTHIFLRFDQGVYFWTSEVKLIEKLFRFLGRNQRLFNRKF